MASILSRLRGLFGRRSDVVSGEIIAADTLPRYLPDPPIEPGPPSRRELTIITRASELDTANSLAAYKLTPERYFAITQLADLGYPLAQCDTYESLWKNDGHTVGQVIVRNSDVLGRPLWVVPGDGRPGSAMAAQRLWEYLEDSNFEPFLEHLMMARYFGYSYGELELGLDGTWIYPKHFVAIPHRRINFDLQDIPHLWQDHSGSVIGNGLGVPMVHPWRWIRAECYGRRLTAAGAFRTTGWFAGFKRGNVRDWLAWAEKYGIPMALGKYEEDASERSRIVLEEAVRRIGRDGNAVMSDDTKIEVLQVPTRAGDAVQPSLIDFCNAEISKALTGATLTSETQGPGSFALGNVHAGRAHKIVVADAKFLQRVFRQSVARPFVQLNGIADAAAPQLYIALLPENPLQDAQLTNTLWAMGLPLSRTQVYRRYGYQPPVDAADTLEKPPDAEPSPAPAPSD